MPDLTRSIAHLVTVQVLTPAGVVLHTAAPTACVLSYDATRAPRITARVETPAPDSQSVLDALDPRSGARVAISTGYQAPDGTRAVALQANLGLRTRTVTRPDDRMTLTAASDEAVVIDAAPTTGTALNGTALAVIQQLVNACFPTPRTWMVSPALTWPTVSYDTSWTDRWSLITDLVDQCNARIYDAGDGTWILDPLDVINAQSRAILSTGPTGTIIRSDAGLDRDGWANRVILDYAWRDAGDVDRKITSARSITSGPWTTTTGNVRVWRQERTIPTTQAQANIAAETLVRRIATRGRTLTLEAIADYTLRPGHTITTQLPIGPQERVVIEAIDHNPIAGVMTLKTRIPDNTPTIGA